MTEACWINKQCVQCGSVDVFAECQDCGETFCKQDVTEVVRDGEAYYFCDLCRPAEQRRAA